MNDLSMSLNCSFLLTEYQYNKDMKSIEYSDRRLNAKSLISMNYINGKLHQTYMVEGQLVRFVDGELEA